ncbi:MAG: hypothetical protein KGI80_00735 [Verrucomicrobiota bacterium]|nr:hypothetical protein [Verrucomicrobiota bacterium]
MVYFVLLLLSSSLFAAAPSSLESPPPKEEVFSFAVDFLYWDAVEDGLEFAYKNSGSQNDQNLTFYEPNFQFLPAFRLRAGGLLPYDNWNLEATYTYYASHLGRSTSASFDPTALPGPGLIAVWTNPAAFLGNNTTARFLHAKSHWKMQNSFLDLALERDCLIGTRFTLAPEWGLRSAWIHQNYNVDYSEGNQVTSSIRILSSSIDMNCFSNNVGPFFGLKTLWALGKGVSLFGHLSTALLASYFHLGRAETDLFLEERSLLTDSVDLTEKYWTFRPEADLSLGFSFLHSFRSVDYFVSAAYETQVWWKQNGLLRYIDELNETTAGASVSQTQGNLTFQGLTLETGIRY